MVLPLGFMPYLPALLVWIIATLILYLVVLSRTSAHPIILILCLCFPGIFENFIFGQNGFLSGALLGGGLLLLDGWPILAGCLFGLLSYKPTLLILALAALIFGRYWKTLNQRPGQCTNFGDSQCRGIWGSGLDRLLGVRCLFP